jgi:hypothetical protein
MTSINRDALYFYSLTWSNDKFGIFEQPIIDEIHDDEEKINKSRCGIYVGNCIKCAQWIPIISLIASTIFCIIFKNSFANFDTGLKIAFVARIILSIVPILFLIDVIGTIVSRCLNANNQAHSNVSGYSAYIYRNTSYTYKNTQRDPFDFKRCHKFRAQQGV